MTLSWKELVCHGLLKEVGEPSLVKKFLKIAMKDRRDYLEKEARAFHTGGGYWEMLNYFRLEKLCLKGRRTGSLKKACSMRTPYQVLQRQVMHELRLSWKERIPEERRRAVTGHKESILLRWRGQGDDIEDLRQQYPSIEKSIKWYGDIHEGRYYLFWDKNIALAIADWARSRRQSKASLMSGFDINIIDGEGVKSIPSSGVYAYDQWTNNPGSLTSRTLTWGAKHSEFARMHAIGKKEKMHIDDMFL